MSVEVRAALHDCCAIFKHSTQQASGLLPDQAPEEGEGEAAIQQAEGDTQAAAVTDAQLLLLHSNCVQIRTVIIVHTFSR